MRFRRSDRRTGKAVLRRIVRLQSGSRREVFRLAKNPPPGPGRRAAVKSRSQFIGPGGHPVKRDTATGRILDVKADLKPFKGVRKEK
jgi:hypothetical protein